MFPAFLSVSPREGEGRYPSPPTLRGIGTGAVVSMSSNINGRLSYFIIFPISSGGVYLFLDHRANSHGFPDYCSFTYRY